MSAVATLDDGPRSLSLPDSELAQVLASSLYPGAKPESVMMVLSYCRAAGLDPMQKPVHIVPMKVKTGKRLKGSRGDYDETEWRDVVMPGIGLYRVQAARTGQLAGIDAPVFGEDIPMPGVPGQVVPLWCRVSVWRVVGGHRCEFVAQEYWLENYAVAGRDMLEPNSMWKRRPRAQLAKCAEAQALRRAFPEVGSNPTADETVIVDLDPMPDAPSKPEPLVVARSSKRDAPNAQPAEDAVITKAPQEKAADDTPSAPAPVAAAAPAAAAPKPGGDFVGAGEVAYLRAKAKSAGRTLEEILAEHGGLVAERLLREDFVAVRRSILEGQK